MAKRRKNNQQKTPLDRGNSVKAEKVAASPTLFNVEEKFPPQQELIIVARIGGFEKVTQTKIILPCTLSQMAFQLAESSFAMAEELAFQAGIGLEHDKDLPL